HEDEIAPAESLSEPSGCTDRDEDGGERADDRRVRDGREPERVEGERHVRREEHPAERADADRAPGGPPAGHGDRDRVDHDAEPQPVGGEGHRRHLHLLQDEGDETPGDRGEGDAQDAEQSVPLRGDRVFQSAHPRTIPSDRTEPSSRGLWHARPMPWPENFDAVKRGEGCAMCEEGRPEESSFGVRILEGRYSDAYLQREAMQRGWVVAVWRGS